MIPSTVDVDDVKEVALVDLAQDFVVGATPLTDIDPVPGAFAHFVFAQSGFIKIEVGHPPNGVSYLHLTPSPAIVSVPLAAIALVHALNNSGGSVGVCPYIDVVAGAVYPIVRLCRLRYDGRCATIQASDFSRKVPGAAVAVHIARDARHAAGAGVLVHIPAKGSVVVGAVVCQPDCITGPECGVIQVIGKPVGIGVHPRPVACLLHGVAEGLSDLSAGVFPQSGGGAFL